MSDTNQPIPTSNNTLANPQDMVDAALSSTPKITMGDDTPLAFAVPAPSVDPTPVAQEQTSSYLPPVSAAPVVPPEQPKKKSKTGIVIGGILLLVLSMGGGIGGYWYYATQSKTPDIQCNADNGYCQQMNANQAKKNNVSDYSTTNNDGTNPLKPPPGMYSVDPSHPDYGKTTGYRYIAAPGVFEGAMKRATEDPNGEGKVDLALLKSHYKMTDEQLSIWKQQKAKGLTFVPGGVGCYNTNDGSISTWDSETGGATGSYNPGTPSDPTNNDCQVAHWTNCVDKGGGIDGLGCNVWYKTTKTGDSYTHKVCDTTTFVCKTVDGPGTDACTGDPDCVNPAPALTCDGLSSSPALTPAPIVGTKLIFTCAGTVTPTSAGTLSYKFRYSINNGTYTALANKTATTAGLTIAACGTYSVECQACATLKGVLTCAPVWTGATQ